MRTAEPGMAIPTAPAVRKKSTGVRSWLVMDSMGQTQVLEAGKYAIMRRTGLPARDLRVLDPILSYPSTVLGRERAIVINLEHVKAIIMAKEVLLLNSMDPFVRPFVQELQKRILAYHQATLVKEVTNDASNQRNSGNFEAQPWLQKPPKLVTGSPQFEDQDKGGKAEEKHAFRNQDGSNVLPFEFIALEACLEAACSSLDNEAKTLELEAHPALDKLTSQISTLNLERVRQIKSRLVAITGRVQKVRDELEHLLDDDDDMAEMYLTNKLVQQELERSSSSSTDEEDNMDDDNTADMEDRNVPPETVSAMHQASTSYGGDIQNDDSARDQLFRTLNTLSTGSQQGTHLNVGELEMLLEAYFVQIDGTLNKLSTLREYVDDTEDYINIMLDDKQNQLLQMGVLMTTATLVITILIVVTGVLGMNIRISIFLTDVSQGMPRFLWTTFSGTAGVIALYIMTISWYKYKGYM